MRRLPRPRRLALLDAFFILVATAIETAGILHQFAPLVLLGNKGYPSTSAALLQAVAYAPGDALSGIDYDIHTVFFGFDILCAAYLILRSTFLPRAIGVLMAIDGAAYLVYSFADFLAPGFAAQLVPWIQFPALLREGSLCLWLLVVGVNVERGKARASNARAHRDLPCADVDPLRSADKRLPTSGHWSNLTCQVTFWRR